jgi:restriction system protein
MQIPDFQPLMLPLLRLASDGELHTLRESIATLAAEFRLTEAEMAELLPSGRQGKFTNRVGWSILQRMTSRPRS